MKTTRLKRTIFLVMTKQMNKIEKRELTTGFSDF